MTYVFNIFDTAVKLKVILANYALLLLNTPIKIDPVHFVPMWKNADVRVCVDEASMTLKTYTEAHNISMAGMYPNLLSGDFRSISPELLKLYDDAGAKVVPTVNDDLTDFTKALHQLVQMDDKIEAVIAVVEPESRLDHTFANLNTISMGQSIFGRFVPVYLLGKYSMSWIIPPGISEIHVPFWIKKYPCGILPFSPSSSNVTTSGLKWNLNAQSIQFNGLISTSNKFTEASIVAISTDVPLIWTMTVNKEDIYADPCAIPDKAKPISHEPHTPV